MIGLGNLSVLRHCHGSVPRYRDFGRFSAPTIVADAPGAAVMRCDVAHSGKSANRIARPLRRATGALAKGRRRAAGVPG